MTTMIRPRTAAPSEIWDVAPRSHTAASARGVRQLTAQNRTQGLRFDDASVNPQPPSPKFEPDRERRDNVLLGAMMAAALIVGSALGGVFGGGEAPAADFGAESQVSVAQVSAAQAR